MKKYLHASNTNDNSWVNELDMIWQSRVLFFRRDDFFALFDTNYGNYSKRRVSPNKAGVASMYYTLDSFLIRDYGCNMQTIVDYCRVFESTYDFYRKFKVRIGKRNKNDYYQALCSILSFSGPYYQDIRLRRNDEGINRSVLRLIAGYDAKYCNPALFILFVVGLEEFIESCESSDNTIEEMSCDFMELLRESIDIIWRCRYYCNHGVPQSELSRGSKWTDCDISWEYRVGPFGGLPTMSIYNLSNYIESIIRSIRGEKCLDIDKSIKPYFLFGETYWKTDANTVVWLRIADGELRIPQLCVCHKDENSKISIEYYHLKLDENELSLRNTRVYLADMPSEYYRRFEHVFKYSMNGGSITLSSLDRIEPGSMWNCLNTTFFPMQKKGWEDFLASSNNSESVVIEIISTAITSTKDAIIKNIDSRLEKNGYVMGNKYVITSDAVYFAVDTGASGLMSPFYKLPKSVIPEIGDSIFTVFDYKHYQRIKDIRKDAIGASSKIVFHDKGLILGLEVDSQAEMKRQRHTRAIMDIEAINNYLYLKEQGYGGDAELELEIKDNRYWKKMKSDEIGNPYRDISKFKTYIRRSKEYHSSQLRELGKKGAVEVVKRNYEDIFAKYLE